MPLIPYVTQKKANYERVSDLYSHLLDQRIIFISEEISDSLASTVVAQLLYLENVDPSKDIQIYINSPGGSVSAGLAICDTMKLIRPDVSTICVGRACSMGAYLLAHGTEGKRYILPSSEVMIHQPLGGTQGQASDILIHAKHIEKTRKLLNENLAKVTKQSMDNVEKDTERDKYMDASEAVAYGLVDHVIDKK